MRLIFGCLLCLFFLHASKTDAEALPSGNAKNSKDAVKATCLHLDTGTCQIAVTLKYIIQNMVGKNPSYLPQAVALALVDTNSVGITFDAFFNAIKEMVQDAGECRLAQGYFGNVFNEHCLTVKLGEKDRTTAEMLCSAEGASMPYIRSYSDALALMQQFPSSKVHINGTDAKASPPYLKVAPLTPGWHAVLEKKPEFILGIYQYIYEINYYRVSDAKQAGVACEMKRKK